MNKFSKIRTLSMIEKSGAYDREPLIAPIGKSKMLKIDLKLNAYHGQVSQTMTRRIWFTGWPTENSVHHHHQLKKYSRR